MVSRHNMKYSLNEITYHCDFEFHFDTYLLTGGRGTCKNVIQMRVYCSSKLTFSFHYRCRLNVESTLNQMGTVVS